MTPTSEELLREVAISSVPEVAPDIGPAAIDPDTNPVAARETWRA